MEKLTCASFFAGVGGIDLGFEQTNKFKTIYANEFDQSAVTTFSLNFPNVIIDTRDIRNVSTNDIPNFDVMLAGFPCQAFSLAGYRKGFDDEKGRGNLFFELTRIIETKRPRIAFFENVKNLVGHDNGNTFRTICNELEKLGYIYTYQVLNASIYGNIAQNRERIYIIAFRDKIDYQNFQWPHSIERTNTVRDIIDFENPIDEKYYYTKGKYKTHNKTNGEDIYTQLRNASKNEDPNNPTIYQWRRVYIRTNKTGVIPTLTANQGTGGHNVCIIHTNDDRFRKMTPRECFNAQGFPNDFKLPEKMANSNLYKQAGNSVCVSVIKRIAENIATACNI